MPKQGPILHYKLGTLLHHRHIVIALCRLCRIVCYWIIKCFCWLHRPFAGPLNDVSALANLGLFSSQALSVASSGNAGSQAPLTLDLANNAFSGVFPSWLFYAIVNAPGNVTINFTVGSDLSYDQPIWTFRWDSGKRKEDAESMGNSYISLRLGKWETGSDALLQVIQLSKTLNLEAQ